MTTPIGNKRAAKKLGTGESPAEIALAFDLALGPRPGTTISTAEYVAAYEGQRDSMLAGFFERGGFDRPPEVAVEAFDADPVVVAGVARFWRERLTEDRQLVERQVAFPIGDPRRHDEAALAVWRVETLALCDRLLARCRKIEASPTAPFGDLWRDLPDPIAWNL